MILVRKGEEPAYLKRAASRATKTLISSFQASPHVYTGETGKALDVKKNIYGHDAVRKALSDAQHGKCCYCEVVIPTPYAHKHVEHFRPKSSFRQDENSTTEKPGYYWLAYS